MRVQIATLLMGEGLLLSGLWFGVSWPLAAGAAGAQLVALSLFADFGSTRKGAK